MTPEETRKQIEELNSLRTQARYWRLAVTLGILTLVLGGVALIVNAAYNLMKEGPQQEKFVGDFTAGLKRDVVPSVERIAKQTMNDVKPVVEKELQKLNDRSPELMDKLKKEILQLQNELPKRGEKVLNNTFGTMLKKREATVRQMFPDATEERVSTLLVSLTEESHNQMHTVSERLFGRHLKSINGIFEHLDAIQSSEAVEVADAMPTWDMALMVLDVVRADMKDLEPETNATAAALPLPAHQKKGQK